MLKALEFCGGTGAVCRKARAPDRQTSLRGMLAGMACAMKAGRPRAGQMVEPAGVL